MNNKRKILTANICLILILMTTINLNGAIGAESTISVSGTVYDDYSGSSIASASVELWARTRFAPPDDWMRVDSDTTNSGGSYSVSSSIHSMFLSFQVRVSKSGYSGVSKSYSNSGGTYNYNPHLNPIDSSNPVVTQPPNIAYDEGETGHTISWTANDDHPTTYTITRGSSTIIRSGYWSDGQTFTVNVDGHSAGSYSYTITLYDYAGHQTTDSVTVTVNELITVSGTVYDAYTGDPIQGATVELWARTRFAPPDDWIIIESTSTNSNGQYSVSATVHSLFLGFEVRVSKNGYHDESNSFPASGGSNPYNPRLDPVDDSYPVVSNPPDITYHEGETGHSISWTTNDDHPTTYTITRGGTTIESGDWIDGQTFTVNVDGHSAGSYTYTITLNDFAGHQTTDSVTVTVNELITVSGTVVDAYTGDPIQGATVELWARTRFAPPDDWIIIESTSTDSNGQYSVSTTIYSLFLGFDVRVSKNGYHDESKSFAASGGSNPYNPQLDPVDDSYPVVSNPPDITYHEGETGHSISWTANDDHPTTYTITRGGTTIDSGDWIDGQTFTVNVDGLSAGSYTYTITLNDFAGHQTTDSVTVTVHEFITVSGTVVDAYTGDPIQGATVELWARTRFAPPDDWIIIKSTSTDSNGQYSVSATIYSLFLGFEVRVSKNGYHDESKSFAASGGSNPYNPQLDPVDDSNPVVSNPPDISYHEGETGHSISWTANDDHPTTYTITRGGTTIDSGDWIDGQTFTVNVDGHSAGSYTYTITLNDFAGHQTTDSVTVTVHELITVSG
ncbi:MAG: hypothetical protein ACXADA_24210, partial [Candidatus Hodarchaeales archaeon]